MLRALLVRLEAIVRRRRFDAELDEELRYHIDREADRNVAAGMSPAEARFAAHRAFGNSTIAAEQARESVRWSWLEELRQDVLYTARTLKRAPLFVATVVATIGLGLGLLATAFTLFNAYVLRPVAVRDPYALYDASWHSRDGGWHAFTWSQFQRIRGERGAFAEVSAVVSTQVRLRGGVGLGQYVTSNYFDMLGVRPALGRTFVPDDDEPGRAYVVVLSYSAWQTTFGGDSTIVGRAVDINGSRVTVVGVARDGFGGLSSVPLDFWVPVRLMGLQYFGTDEREGFRILGRLAASETPTQATALLTSRMRAWTNDRPELKRANDVMLVPRGTVLPRTWETVALFMPIGVAFGLVMLIACANVANMMLARGMARQREIGIRLSLGAGRGRLVRQLLTEALLLALPAGAAGLVVSRVAIDLSIRAMYATVPSDYISYLRVVPLDGAANVVAFIFLAAIAAAIVFALAPALQATKAGIVHASRGDFDTQYRPSRLRSALVVGQISMSVLLLVCAGLLLSMARQSRHLDPGVRASGVVQIELLKSLSPAALDRLRSDPMVRAAASVGRSPLDGLLDETLVAPAGRPSESVYYNTVSPEYFSLMELPVVAGRAFSADDVRGHDAVVIVSQSTASRFWPGRDPIGEVLSLPANSDVGRLAAYRTARVVGVTRDAPPGWIGKSARERTVFYPQPLLSYRLLVRVNGDVDRGRAHVDSLLNSLDSTTVVEAHTTDASMTVQLYPFRAAYWVASAVGVIALMLTLTGVFGVFSYVVAQRRREFGIRLALGATPSELVALVLRQSLRLAALGAAVGVTAALGVSRLLGSMVVTVDAYDPTGYAVGALVVLITCLAAAYVPSRRAALVNPVEALRAD